MATSDWFNQVLMPALVDAGLPANLKNPYRCPSAAANLSAFFTIVERNPSALLLVGEAPGYRGAAITGVPFTSTAILLAPWDDPWGAFGPGRGFRECPDAGFRREATATIFWQTIADLGLSIPITWNAVPFHPVADRVPNRPVEKKDIRIGLPFLEAVLSRFSGRPVVAVGNAAAAALEALDVPYAKIRHPSRGGKSQFYAGLADASMRSSSGAPAGPTNL